MELVKYMPVKQVSKRYCVWLRMIVELVNGMPVKQVSKKILRLVEDASGVSKGHASKASK